MKKSGGKVEVMQGYRGKVRERDIRRGSLPSIPKTCTGARINSAEVLIARAFRATVNTKRAAILNI